MEHKNNPQKITQPIQPAQALITLIAIGVFALSSQYNTIALLGYAQNTNPYTRITYIFAHASLLHLIINLYVFNALCITCRKLKLQLIITVAFCAAIIATFGTEKTLPTVGASGMVYAIIGAMIVKIHNKKFLIITGTIIIAQIITLFLNTNNNCLLHLLAMAYGYILYLITNNILNKIKKHKQTIKTQKNEQQNTTTKH